MLFYLDKNDTTTLVEVESRDLKSIGWLEKDLENLIAKHIDRFIREDDLFVFFQERRRQEEPDIMALDRSGTLYIFELKRWASSQETLLQVLRYGQRFGTYDFDALNHLFRSYQKHLVKTGENDLRMAHKRHFELDEPLSEGRFNFQQKFVVITDGLDRKSREAIEYWSEQKLPVTALVYRVYETTKGEHLLDFRPFSANDLGFEDVREGLVVVNTNSAYMPNAWQEMLDQGKAAAYFDRKRTVQGIDKGSHIALYHTGVGIIAIGRTTSDYRRNDVEDQFDEEYYLPCEFDVKVCPRTEPEKAVTARQINEFLGSKHSFRGTVNTLPIGVIDFVRNELKQGTANDE